MSAVPNAAAAAAAAFGVARIYHQAELAGRNPDDIKTEEFFPLAERYGREAVQLALVVQAELLSQEADAFLAWSTIRNAQGKVPR
jgi:hypothetical protein